MNGLLVIDKPGGMTSHDVVARVRRLTQEKSVGHLGTLDPMATGVLPLMPGKYTRLAQFFSTAEKTYTGTIRFGFATDTYDAEGLPAGPVTRPELTLEQIRQAAAPFHGEVEQMPPAYSAKKINGQPAYKLAREGKPVELQPKTIQISNFTIGPLDGDTAAFEITVSAGGYIRSIAHDLGQSLGCGAHLSSLRRTRAGVFTLAEAHTLDSVAADPMAALIHPRLLLPEMPCVTADETTLGKLRNGAQINLSDYSQAELAKVFASQSDLAAIAKRVAGTLFQPIVVMM